jgi:hypothetical protein
VRFVYLMAGREEIREVLEDQVAIWSKKTHEQIVAELPDMKAYEVRVGEIAYQVEVELLENTESYIHVSLAVDNGQLPAAMFPLCNSFILKKHEPHS